MVRRLGFPRRSSEYAWLITGPLAVAALVCALWLPHEHLDSAPVWLLGLLATAGFVLANVGVLNFVVRRQAFSISVAEIPLVLALYYLSPIVVIFASTAATVVTQSRLKVGPTKLCFNAAKAAAAAAAACLVVALLSRVHDIHHDVGPRTWGVLFAAVSTNTFMTLAAVAGVISVVQGWQAGREVVRTGATAVVTVTVNVAIGLVFLMAIETTRWSVALLVVLLGALALLYRSYSQFFRQHRTLADVYELTRVVGESSNDGTLPDALLGKVRSLMKAEFATLWLPAQGRHPEVMLTARVDDRGLLDVSHTPTPVRERALRSGLPIGVGPRLGEDNELRAQLRVSGIKDVVAVPLRSGQATVGSLEVVNRLGDPRTFTRADVQVLETIAAHVAVAVENSRLVDRLRYDAYHDRVTGLPNRRRIVDALAASISVRAPGEVVAVLVADVDGMREVNESMGYVAGDKLLVEVGRRLKGAAAAGALVGRMGGDEFVVTMRAESVDEAVAIATELRRVLHAPMIFGSLTLDVDTAVGVAVHPDHGDDAEALLQHADVAATAAKAVPGGVQLFHPALESRAVRRSGLAADLKQALEGDELEVYFQPKVTLADRRLVGVECLARWNHPAHGWVDPEDFVAVAEHTGQLGRLTQFVLREGLRRCRDWSDADRPLAIAVNLSSRTLADPLFPDLVEQLLSEYNVAPGTVTFEVAESGMVGEIERALPTVIRLRQIGVRLSVDDFGSGRSSLSYLHRLPVQEVKIDGSCVQGMATSAGDLSMVRAVLALAREFGLSVVAEGVESERTLQLLKEARCEVGQGYLFSRPLPFERLEAWFGLRTSVESTPTGEIRRLRVVP
jgi:diguanylate cyclase (GGDEF)-like protein